MRIHAGNITIDRWSKYFKSKDPSCLIPFIGRFYEDKLNEQFAEMFNEGEAKALLESNRNLLYFFNRGFNVYPSLHQAISLNLQLKNIEALKKLFKIFEKYFDRPFSKLTDLDSIINEAKRLQRKYKSMLPEKTEEVEEIERDFEDYIVAAEEGLSLSINRNIRLHQFMSYWRRALKKSKANDGS